MNNHLNNNKFFLFFTLLCGYLSLSFEILSIRMFTPFFGAGLAQTGIIIGIVLLFLSLGSMFYQLGNTDKAISRNLLLIGALSGLLLTHSSTHYANLVLSFIPNDDLRLFVIGIFFLGPVAFLYGQILPLLIQERKDIGPGLILGVSTLGSFLGSVGTSFLIYETLSFSSAVFLNLGIIFVLSLAFRSDKRLLWFIPVLVFSVYTNFYKVNKLLDAETGFGAYQVHQKENFKGLILNGTQYSSIILNDDDSSHYIEWIHKYVLNGKKPLDVLVLGAAGFTVSLKNKHHNYTYVDMDPKMKEVIKEIFNPNATGAYVVKDARAFLLQTDKKYDVVLMDINSHRSHKVPPHLATLEVFRRIKKILNPGGLFGMNFIHQGVLAKAKYGRKIANTINNVFTGCYYLPLIESGMVADPEKFRQTLALCPSYPKDHTISTDDKY